MKKFLFIAFVLVNAVNSLTVFSQQAEQKVLVTLQKGEEPMYYESRIPLSFTDGNLHLVTRANGQFYVYDNGTRKGPFKTASAIAVSDNENSGSNNSGCAVRQFETEDFDKFVKVGDDGNTMVVYNGKTYSEFYQVVRLATSENGTKIAAVGTNANWEPMFLTPDGKVTPLEGETQNLIMSPTGNIAIVTMKGAKTTTMVDAETQMANMQKMAEEMQSIDYASLTPEQLEARIKSIQQKYGIEDNNDSNNPDYYMYLSNGKKIGPYKLGGYASDNPAFNITGGDNWYFIDDNKLFINGLQVKDFGYDSPSVCNVWISPDGKRYAAFIGYEKLVFSDGQSFDTPLQIEPKVENSKAYLTWITLNAKMQIVLYKKAI